MKKINLDKIDKNKRLEDIYIYIYISCFLIA